MRTVPGIAVQTALNTLSLIEEESVEESRRLRRLLPALASHFAKANRYPSEQEWLKIVYDARERGISLRDYFNDPLPSQKVWSYEEIARRLNVNYDHKKGMHHHQAFGHVNEFRDLYLQTDHSEAGTRKMMCDAAATGHLALCDFLYLHIRSKSNAWDSIIINAKVHKQFHILYELAKREEMSAKDFFYQRGAITDQEAYKQYEMFAALYTRIKKQVPSVLPEHFTGLENWHKNGFKLQSYLAIRDILSHEIPNIRVRNRESFKAAMLFQTPQRLLRFLHNWGKHGHRPLEALLNKIEPPYVQGPDWEKWGNALLKYGPEMFYPVQFAQKLVTPAINQTGHMSVRETRRRIWEECFPHDKHSREISRICFEGAISRQNFNAALKLWTKAAEIDPAPANSVPDIEINCKKFGLHGYKLIKFPYSDPRIMFLGHYNGCCEHIGNHFEDTIIDAVTTRQSAFYVLMKGDDIRAHSWVWRGQGGQLIIDGWESIDQNVDTDFLYNLTNEITQYLSRRVHQKYGITDIILGLSNKDYNPQGYFDVAERVATRIVCQEYYMDEPHQWLIKCLKKPVEYETYIPDPRYKLGYY